MIPAILNIPFKSFKQFQEFQTILHYNNACKAASSAPLLFLNNYKEISLGILFYTSSNFLAFVSDYL